MEKLKPVDGATKPPVVVAEAARLLVEGVDGRPNDDLNGVLAVLRPDVMGNDSEGCVLGCAEELAAPNSVLWEVGRVELLPPKMLVAGLDSVDEEELNKDGDGTAGCACVVEVPRPPKMEPDLGAPKKDVDAASEVDVDG